MSMSYVYYLKAVSPIVQSNSTTPPPNQGVVSDLKKIVLIFILLLILDLVIIIYAMVCLFSSHLPWYLTVILLVLLFCPYIGFITAIGIIIYYHVNKKKSNTYSFEFY